VSSSEMSLRGGCLKGNDGRYDVDLHSLALSVAMESSIPQDNGFVSIIAVILADDIG
jgi:hypothetical protein